MKVAQLLADTTRARILFLLMDGRAHTATELAIEGDVMPATASFHLRKLVDYGLLSLRRQGRHRYYCIASSDIAATVESLLGITSHANSRRNGNNKVSRELAVARTCYDHLAGEYAVAFYDALIEHGLVAADTEPAMITPQGERYFASFGINCEEVKQQRRLYCGACLDWTERRSHLSGAMGAAVLIKLRDLKWIRTVPDSRRVSVSDAGRAFLKRLEL